MEAGVLGAHGHHVVPIIKPQVEENVTTPYLRMEVQAALEMK